MAEPATNRLRRLECLRGAAALYVFAHHYVHVVLSPHHPQIARLFKFGQFAVLLFFWTRGRGPVTKAGLQGRLTAVEQHLVAGLAAKDLGDQRADSGNQHCCGGIEEENGREADGGVQRELLLRNEFEWEEGGQHLQATEGNGQDGITLIE